MNNSELIYGVNPATGEQLQPGYPVASTEQIEESCNQAYKSYRAFKTCSPAKRADFLDQIAAEILAIGDVLLETANIETGLPLARLTGERGRTCGQLQMFASFIREGKHDRTHHDAALPDRQPLPRSDLVRTYLPLGPIAVFGASNFPLAFSVAGGDTASALAAGCSVVVKGHPAHPWTSALIAGAVLKAATKTGMPEHVFQMLFCTNEGATALVQHPRIQGVGFTGSQRVGLHLWRTANARPVPIPVFAEMGSINPVFVLPGALAERAAALAEGWFASLTLGVGQFCTNPGIIVLPVDEGRDLFVQTVTQKLSDAAPGTMLTAGIAEAYHQGAAHLASQNGVVPLSTPGNGPFVGVTDAAQFLAHPVLSEEVFGPAGLIVTVSNSEEMLAVAENLSGQLTATIHRAASDSYAELLEILEERAGRIVFNGFPTGVEVCPAMQHGGPFPATTDSRFTSVGTAAIERWLRPVCYQDRP